MTASWSLAAWKEEAGTMARSSAGGAEGRRRARRYTMRCRARGRRHGAEEHDDVEVREDQGSRGGAEEGVGLEGRRWRPERWRLGAGPSEVRAMTLSACAGRIGGR
jgi:hypothetical protein